MRGGKKYMRVTIQRTGIKDVVLSCGNSKTLRTIADGYMAERIRLEIDFDGDDIKNIHEFLDITKFCFPNKNK